MHYSSNNSQYCDYFGGACDSNPCAVDSAAVSSVLQNKQCLLTSDAQFGYICSCNTSFALPARRDAFGYPISCIAMNATAAGAILSEENTATSSIVNYWIVIFVTVCWVLSMGFFFFAKYYRKTQNDASAMFSYTSIITNLLTDLMFSIELFSSGERTLFYCISAALGLYLAVNNVFFTCPVYRILRRNHANSKLIESYSRPFTVVFVSAVLQVGCFEILSCELFNWEFLNFEFSDDVVAFLRRAPVSILLYTAAKLVVQIFRSVAKGPVSTLTLVALCLSVVTLIQNILNFYFKMSAAGQRTEMEKLVYQKINHHVKILFLPALEAILVHVQAQVEAEATMHLKSLWQMNSIARDQARAGSDMAQLRKEVLHFFNCLARSRAERLSLLRDQLWNIMLTKAEFTMARVDIFQLALDTFDFVIDKNAISQQRALISGFDGSAQKLYELAENQQCERLQRIESECDMRLPTQLAEKISKHIKSFSNENFRLWSKACAACISSVGQNKVCTLGDIDERELSEQLKILFGAKEKHVRHQRSRLLKQEWRTLFELQNSQLLSFAQALRVQQHTPSGHLDDKAWDLLFGHAESFLGNASADSTTASYQLSSFSTIEKECSFHLDNKRILAPLSAEFVEQLKQWRHKFIQKELNNLTSTLLKEKEFAIQANVALHKLFHKLVIYTPKDSICCNSKVTPAQPVLGAVDTDALGGAIDTQEVTVDMTNSRWPTLYSKNIVQLQEIEKKKSDARLRQLLNEVEIVANASEQAMKASRMLAAKLEEHGALFLYEKLRAHSITLDLLSTLNVNELTTHLKLNYGESKKLRGVITALSSEESSAAKRKRRSKGANQVAPSLEADEEPHSSSSSYTVPELDAVENARNLLSTMKAKLGVAIAPLPQGATGGVRVAAVISSSAAALGDLRADDVVLTVNGAAVHSPEQYAHIIYLFSHIAHFCTESAQN